MHPRGPAIRRGPSSCPSPTTGPDGTGHNGDMAEDDIERLLREVSSTTSGPAKPATPAERTRGDVEQSGRSAGGRFAFAAVAGGVTGVGAFLFAVFTPWTDALDMGFAAAAAAFVTDLVSGPPRWFSS